MKYIIKQIIIKWGGGGVLSNIIKGVTKGYYEGMLFKVVHGVCRPGVWLRDVIECIIKGMLLNLLLWDPSWAYD